jgi:hypothetical protein
MENQQLVRKEPSKRTKNHYQRRVVLIEIKWIHHQNGTWCRLEVVTRRVSDEVFHDYFCDISQNEVITTTQDYLTEKFLIQVYFDESPQWIQRIYWHFHLERQGKDQGSWNLSW